MFKRVLDIKPTYATRYDTYLQVRKKSLFRKPPARQSTRMLSDQSRRQLMTAVNWLILFSPEIQYFNEYRKKLLPFRLNFITLTLAETQHEDDAYIKNRLLQPFLKWIIRKGAIAYIWKAETQNNGNIHFHITTNKYIDCMEIRTKWNQLQQDHGFLNSYQAEFKSNDPNSTDVHSVYKYADLINNIGSYFGKLDEWCHKKGTRIPKENINHPSKYLEESAAAHKSFPVPKRQVNGRKWSVSNNLTGIKCDIDDESLRGCEFEQVYDHFMSETPIKTLTRDYAEIYIYDENKLFKNIHPLILDRLSDQYNDFVVNAPKP